MSNARSPWLGSRTRKKDGATALKAKFRVLYLGILIPFCLLVAQLCRMQLVNGAEYRQRAEYNRLRLLPVPAQRGVMYDRNGKLLVRNVPSFSAAIVPADLPLERQKDVCAKLSRLLYMPAEDIGKLVDEPRDEHRLFTPIILKKQLDREVAFALEERRAELPGVQVIVEPMRQYLDGPTTAHLLGYVGPISTEEYAAQGGTEYQLDDRLGKTGLELIYEEQLRGKPGREQVEVDVNGQTLRVLQREEPEPGSSLVLSIDIDLQRKMTQFLAEGMGQSQYAAAIAMDPRTGEILGLVSLPSYDNNLFATPLSEQELEQLLDPLGRPLLNHATSGAYPPGSIFKLVTGTAALEERVATRWTQIHSAGSISVPSRYNPNVIYTFYDYAPLGWLDFYRAVALSSDVYFYYLAGGYHDFRGLGVERLARYARSFGLGQKTGIDLPSEVSGLIPDPEWKWQDRKEEWVTGDTYNMGIGQGFVATTPLQMLEVVSSVANGGTLLRPQVVREIVNSRGEVVVPFDRDVVGEVPVSKENLVIFREGMRQAVTWGTGTSAQVRGIEVAGKTGTAEYGVPSPETGKYPTHGWFVCFAPYEDPEIALVVFVERGWGNQDAAPIAGKILRYYFHVEEESPIKGSLGG